MPLVARELERHFPLCLDSIGDARRFVLSALEGEVDSHTAAVLTSEVATNAVRHANCDFYVRVQVGDATVRVEVINDAPELLLIRRNSSAEGGHGLRILDDMARDWGVETRQHDKVVWFELERAVAAGTRAHRGA